MISRIRIQTFALVAGSLFATLVALPVVTYADLAKDIHIQETGNVRVDVDKEAYQEFARLFRLGYPPATVMINAVNTGMSLNDILYVAVRSNVNRAQEFYDTAKSLVGVLPGWVCQEKSERERYIKAATKSELGSNPTIRQVADLFFNRGSRLVPFPDWEHGHVHMDASVDELASLSNDKTWYVPGKNDGTPLSAPNRPVFVSLYKNNREIVVGSGGKERIRLAREQGRKQLPVVMVYNDPEDRPISSFGADVTVADLAHAFYSRGLELTPVPEWEVGDYHLLATPAQLRAVVKMPDRKEIPPARWNAARQELKKNVLRLTKPLLLTLVRSGGGHAWINRPEVVAVASDLGVKALPIVLFYHLIDRTPCGEPADCDDMLCRAATAAGAPPEVCGSSGKQNTAAGDSPGGNDGAATDNPLGLKIDPHLYDGLRYTQNQCTS